MKYNCVSPLERFFNDEKCDMIKNELASESKDCPEFSEFIRLCKGCLDRDDFSDEFADRLLSLMCYLIDHELVNELISILVCNPFWGSYSAGTDELTALCYCILKNTEIAKKMIDVMAPNHLSALETYQPGYIAIEEGNENIIRYLIEHGDESKFFSGYYTGVQHAVINQNLGILKILVEEYNHNVNEMCCCMTPPITFAVKNDDYLIVDYLLSLPNIEVNKADSEGKNPIEYAKSKQILELLSDNGAKPASENVKLICAAIELIKNGDGKNAMSLIKKLAEIKDASAIYDQYDLLYYTVKYDDYDCTMFIIDKGLVDLTTYEDDLVWLTKCVYRPDRHERSEEERKAYIDLFLKNGYKLPKKPKYK